MTISQHITEPWMWRPKHTCDDNRGGVISAALKFMHRALWHWGIDPLFFPSAVFATLLANPPPPRPEPQTPLIGDTIWLLKYIRDWRGWRGWGKWFGERGKWFGERASGFTSQRQRGQQPRR